MEKPKDEFIGLIKKYVRDSAVKSNFELIADPPGKSPSQALLTVSKWFNSLNKEDQEMTQKIAQMTLDQGIHNFLCILDGVKILSGKFESGEFILLFKNEDEGVRINDKGTDLEELHDVYAWEINQG